MWPELSGRRVTMAPLLICLVLSLLLGVDGTSPTKYLPPKPICDPNEHYEENSNSCEKTCANMDHHHLMGACKPTSRCFCDSDYVRNEDGKCVRPCECKKVCGENEIHVDCRNICPGQHCGVDPRLVRCAEQPCEPGCDCKEGYQRNDAGKCIPKHECPGGQVCGKNEIPVDCRNICPGQHCGVDPRLVRCAPQPCEPGCDCKEGYQRNDAGECIPKHECPGGQVCGENEIPVDCRNICPGQGCGVDPSLFKCPERPCEPGCDCKEGYLRNYAGECIPKHECPGAPPGPRPPKCRANEVLDKCPDYCHRDTCASRRPGFKCPQLPAIPLPCRPRCVCVEGYLRNDYGHCVPEVFCPKKPAKCGRHQEYSECGSSCPLTCDNMDDPERFCSSLCRSGCFCIEGYVLNRQGMCVLPEQCRGKHCAHNEVFKHCRQNCPPQKCSARLRKYRCAVNQLCESGCDCKPGYLRDEDGNCIPRKDCPPLPSECSRENHEVYLKCGSYCAPTCENYGKEIGCPAVCVPGCYCEKGYVRDESTGRCLRLEECPNRQCGKYEVFKECRTICPAQDCGVDPTVIRCGPPPCEPGCDCLPGYLRDITGFCIPKEQCPGETHCAHNEVFKQCNTKCPPRTCSARLYKYKCAAKQPCEPGCACRPGYLRDEDGKCIPIKDCPRLPSECSRDNHEVYLKCGSYCAPTCENYGKEISCPAVCVPGCYCEKGYVRDESTGRCLRLEECPNRQCGKYEVFKECRTICPAQDCGVNPTVIRCASPPCEPGCDCLPGYLRDKDGFCIPKDQCPGAPEPPQWCSLENHEIYLECGSECPDTCDNYGKGQGCNARCVPGCFCREGYVRDEITGRCLLPEECPSRECGPNQVFSNCGTSCPQTCDTLDKQTNKICTDECRVGCVCVPGYVLDDQGECVLPEQCRGSNQCGPYEVYSDCRFTCPPQSCESIYTSYLCVQPQSCEPGCDCISGYLRDKSGACIPSDQCFGTPGSQQCGSNEVYRKCRTLCPPQRCESIYTLYRCVQPQPCEPGCDCIPGYLRDKSGACVLSDQCPGTPGSQQCGSNEVYSKCRILCPPQKCESIYTLYKCVTPQPCEPGCDCISGYLRDKSGACILSDKCPDTQPETCGENEEFNACGTACQKTCKNKDIKINCIAKCEKGCFCVQGYVRNETGACVLPEQCPANNQCKDPNEEFLTCGSACPDTCENIDSKNRVCTLQCVAGCFCRNGFVRRKDGVCVYPDECDSPKQCTGVNEEYSDCGSACPKTCKNKDAQIKCIALCKKGCFCLPGYVRNNQGLCVLPSQCTVLPRHCTGVNEEYSDCGSDCLNRCDNRGYACAAVCGPGCFCIPGYVRNDRQVCVHPSQCPSNQTCGPNEVHHPCRYICPPQTCESIYTDYSCLLPQPCEPGCDCVTDYLRNKSGVCIPADQCPGAPQSCGKNEQYDTCGTACPRTCKNKDIKINCIDKCVEGCLCLPGYVRNEAGACVLPKQCPAPNQCKDPNEVFLNCGSSCPDTCDNYKDKSRICTRLCVRGCFCKKNYVRRNDGRCVLPAQCPKQCGKKEVFKQCGTACPATCENPNPRVCTKQCVVGCFCADGLVRDANNNCIPPEQCPIRRDCNGDPHAIPGCQNCEETCDKKKSPFKQCENPPEENCDQKCKCIPGYVRDETKDICVRPERCSNINCPPTKVYSSCAWSCPTYDFCPKDDTPRRMCSPPFICHGGCACPRGQLINKDGRCIPAEKCPHVKCTGKNQMYDPCPSACHREDCADKDNQPTTCNTLVKHECSPRCICLKNHFRKNGTCVPYDECPKQCGKDEVFKQCGTACPATCENPNPRVCTRQCVAGCFCVDGLVRDANNNCIKPEQCPAKTCPANERYVPCVVGFCIPKKCSERDEPVPCPDIIGPCAGGCICDEGFLRDDNGKCVPENQCPGGQGDCNGDPNAIPGCQDCKKTCASLLDPPRRPLPDCPSVEGCKDQCKCKDGYVKDEATGLCVLAERCSNINCGPNQVFDPCAFNCSRTDFCPVDNTPRTQCSPPFVCNGGCKCKSGYLIDKDGNCILATDCPPIPTGCRGDPNAKPGCQDCKKTCASLTNPPRRPLPDCPPIKGCEGQCQCKDGYVKDESTGLCVLPERCSNINCGPNQRVDTCAFNCSSTAYCPEDYEPRYPCFPPFVCNVGCVCIKGYLIDKNGNCIPENKCPPPKCPRNEVYVSCVLGHCKAKRCSQRNKPIPCPKIRPPCPGGCICREGWLRDDNEKCVPENQCPATNQCKDPNEVFLDCGSSCPDTCDNYKDKSRICTLQCVRGCFCKKDYVRRNDGRCVLPAQCPPKKCPQHEVYVNCVLGQCKHTHCDQVGQPIACPGILGHCAGGCICEPGYLRDASGKCIPENQCRKCPPNSKYYSCKPWCTVETCAQKENPPVCIPERDDCVGGCVCDKGHLRNAQGNCIPESECPSRCGPNAIYSLCKPHCAVEKCSQVDNPPMCIPEHTCVAGCSCVKGYLRNYEGVCVPENQCPKNTCADPNAEPGCMDCTQTCKAIVNPPRICPRPACRPSDCKCKEGYVNDTAIGFCVKPEKCSNIKCTYPKVFARCAYNCESDYCPKSDGPAAPCFPPYVCPAGCKCRFDHRIDEYGNCIPTEKCPSFECPRQNEVHDPCPSPCRSESCEDRDKPATVCNTLVKNCIPRCVCRKNHWRNLQGLCVPYDQCRCPTNETYSECFHDCPPRECGADGIYFCPLQTESNCKQGCVCLDGYVRNSSGACIKKEDCPNQCPPGEVYNSCGTACPETCENYGQPIGCNKQCVPGCYCPKGQVRSKNGDCIDPKDCPKIGCNGDPNARSGCSNYCGHSCTDYDGPSKACPLFCRVGGCACNEGYVYDAVREKCVNPKDCSNKVCEGDPNAVLKKCPQPCPATCSRPEPINCLKACKVIGCECKPGYVLGPKGKCIRLDQCSAPQCPTGEVYNSCGSACIATCANRGQPQSCTQGCVAGCFCSAGLYRNDENKCVNYENCTCNGDPNTKPGCGIRCGNTCADYDKNKTRICPMACNLFGCDCREGYIYDDVTGKCVIPQDCTNPTQCPKGEIYKECGTACPYTCDNRGAVGNCTKQCVSGCFCPDKYYRNDKNKCVKFEECTCNGDPRTKPGCGTHCGNTCRDHKAITNRRCPIGCSLHGCDCRKPYVFDQNTKTCVLVEECTPQCGDNETYQKCGTTCPLTCDNYKNPPPCVHQCVEGCFCREGYVRASNNTCIRKENCPHKCPKHQTYVNCAIRCPTDYCPINEGPFPICDPLFPCPGGCVCESGYKLDRNTKECIPVSKCPPVKCSNDNEIFTFCPPLCRDDTCANRNKPVENCGTGCGRMRCVCRPGYYRDENGDCVPEHDCPDQCKPGEVYNSCGTACPETCENYGKPIVCTKQCVPGCYCPKGQVRSKNGNCIDPKDCPKSGCNGDPNAVSGCSNYCGHSCTDYDGPPKACPLFCRADGCACNEGYVYDAVREKCVHPKDCSNKVCEGDHNAVLKKCPEPCPATCSRPEPINCLKACKVIGCECKPGYVLGPNGKCIRLDQCSGNPPRCRKHEVYKECKTKCPPQSCIAKYALFKCASNQTCEPGCDCVPGYLRNSTGHCIPSEQCPPMPCPTGEVYDTCGTACPDTCDNYKHPRACTEQCVSGCFCPKGQVRNANGKCTDPKNCPYEGCKDHNAEVVKCPQPCPGTCSHPKPIPCKIACKRFGCQCKTGYVVGPKGKCIRLYQCPGKVCGENEIPVDCRNICPGQRCGVDPRLVLCAQQPCEPGCDCKEGYQRNDAGKCIPKHECPGDKKCGLNQMFVPCAFYCPTDDCPKDDGPVPQCLPPPPEYCKPGCRCLPGYKFVRNSNRTRCVRQSDCPPIKCSQEKEEVYSKCPPPCLDESCENRNKPKPCCKVKGCGSPRCICRKGYYRNPEGECVAPCDCPDT